MLSRPAHLAALSCLYFRCLPDSTGGCVIPAAHNSAAEEVSPDFEAALPHFERVCRAPGRSHTVRCSVKTVDSSLGSLGNKNFVDHVRMVPPLLQRGQFQFTQPLTF